MNARDAWCRLLAALLLVAAFADVPAVQVAAEQWRVTPGDTLYGIARALSPDDRSAQTAIRIEILRLNPTAFLDGDPGRLVAGVLLSLPGAAATEAPSRLPPQPRPTASEDRAAPPVGPAYEPAAPAPKPRALAKAGPLVRTSAAPAAPNAGRVVIARGPVHAVGRGGERRTLTRRSPIYPGDTLATGKASYAQVRFTDGSLVSLRPDTEFLVEAYRYGTRHDGEEQAFFRLIKGGFRTITGLVGRHNKAAYRVDTPVATIGIRGTHYGVFLCAAGGCAAPPSDGGAKALPDGLYGGVVQGAIVAENEAGKFEFSTDQFFRVPARRLAPESLPADPGILFTPDVLPSTEPANGQSASSQTGEGKSLPPPPPLPSQPTSAQASEGVAVEGQALVTQTPVFQSGEVIQAEAAAIAGAGAVLPGAPAPAGAVAAVSFIDRDTLGQLEAGGGPVKADGTSQNAILLGDANVVQGIVFTSTQAGDNCNPCIFDAGTAQVTDVGGLGGVGTGVNWGRWLGGYAVSENGVQFDTLGDLHYIYSPNLTTPAQLQNLSGFASFMYAGGTAPTDELGRAGQVNSAYLSVDFGKQELTNMSLSVKTPDGAGYRYWDASYYGNLPFDAAVNGEIPLQGSCSGCASSLAEGDASLNFIGAGAERAMSRFGLRDATGTNAVTGTMALDQY